jgi:HK97 family phage major capsid protein
MIWRVQVSNVGDFQIPIGRRGATSSWVGERETRAETNTPTLGLVTPPGGELMSYAESTQWLLDDGAFNVEAWLTTNILDEHAFQEGAAFISGNGVNKPRGFLSHTPVTTADATRDLGILQYVPSGVAGR